MIKKKWYNKKKAKKKKEKENPPGKAPDNQRNHVIKNKNGGLRLFTIDNVAARLAVSKPTVERMLARGILPYYKIGKLTRIKSEDLEIFLTERLVINDDGEK